MAQGVILLGEIPARNGETVILVGGKKPPEEKEGEEAQQQNCGDIFDP